jgi:hypothetical protein
MTPPETRDSRGAIVKLIVGILILALSISAVAVTADDYAKEWNRMSAEHDRLMATPAGQSYERQLVNVHNTFWRAIYVQCSPSAKREGAASFRAIAVIDRQGTVNQFLPMPNSQNFACFSERMVGKRYPAPPSAPFYERFTIDLSDD